MKGTQRRKKRQRLFKRGFELRTNALEESIMTQAPPTFGQALRFWIKLGFISFGGPAFTGPFCGLGGGCEGRL
jgi:hypothetical protein